MSSSEGEMSKEILLVGYQYFGELYILKVKRITIGTRIFFKFGERWEEVDEISKVKYIVLM